MRVLRQVTINDERLKKFPFRRELSMQAYLMENEEILNLDDDTYTDVQIYDEEISLKNAGKKSNDGRLDMVAFYGGEHVAIIELKKNEINEDSLRQLEGYLSQRKQLLKKTDITEVIENNTPSWIGLLVGDSISKSLSDKISNGYLFENEIPIAALTIERYRGNGNTYVITDTYFKNTSKSKDYTRYKFLGQSYNKRRLVLAVVKHFVENNDVSTVSEIDQAFKMNGKSNPVVASLEEAMKIDADTGHARHFLKADEVLQLKDANKTRVAVNNQWGTGNISLFLSRAKENGFEIKIEK